MTDAATSTTAAPALERRAADLDAADPLRGLLDRFVDRDADEGALAYLDGNSLGRPTRTTAERLERFVREAWGGRLIRGWYEGWMGWPLELGDRLGRVCLGAAPGQIVVADSTSVMLYKLARAAVAARPDPRETRARSSPTSTTSRPTATSSRGSPASSGSSCASSRRSSTAA